jgi:regulator of cell morphogenesis and NO signaling
MTDLNADTNIGDLVTENPSRSRVFEQLGIDYCCGGKTSLTDACTERGIDTAEVLERLRAADQAPIDPELINWSEVSMAELIDHIETVHHVYLRQQLPHLSEMVAKVGEVHGERHPELHEVQKVFGSLKSELESHMMKEEKVLFPFIRRLESATVVPPAHLGSIGNPIRVMEHEHDEAGRALARMRDLTGDYIPPDDACSTFKALLEGLKNLELDLHQHIHEENNILFAKALARESELSR